MPGIYLDHAATTPLDPAVLEAMAPYWTERFGNPSSVHGPGRTARHAVEQSRERVAACLGAEPSEIVFTGGGTEADNLALVGCMHGEDGHLVTSAVEHEAVLRTAQVLDERGARITVLTPALHGAPSVEQVAGALGPNTALVSVMLVNNELGTVAPIPAIGEVCREAGVPLHTDAVQAAGLLPLSVDDLGVDLLSLSGHKIYGPKGIGVLFVRGGVNLRPHLHGGAQERGRRAGTESVAAIVGMAEALERACRAQTSRATHARRMRDRLLEGLRDRLGEAFVHNTPVEGPDGSAPHILSISFPPQDGRPLDGEMLLLNLDVEGVYVSAGSACTSGALEPSHVLLALGRDRATAAATLRFSVGKDTTPDEIDRAVAAVNRVLRRMNYGRVSLLADDARWRRWRR